MGCAVLTEADVRDGLREVIDPELGVNIVDPGLVYGIHVNNRDVRITMTMTSPACPLRDYLQDLVEVDRHVTRRRRWAHRCRDRDRSAVDGGPHVRGCTTATGVIRRL